MQLFIGEHLGIADFVRGCAAEIGWTGKRLEELVSFGESLDLELRFAVKNGDVQGTIQRFRERADRLIETRTRRAVVDRRDEASRDGV